MGAVVEGCGWVLWFGALVEGSGLGMWLRALVEDVVEGSGWGLWLRVVVWRYGWGWLMAGAVPAL